MNELLQQFLIESRELLESAADELETLRQSPEDTERLDALLRALHTVKGGAGIVAFGAMERTMHAAEDILGTARDHRHPITATQFEQCTALFDQTLDWLETIERTGVLPPSADLQANEMISGLGHSMEPTSPVEALHQQALPPSWLEELGTKYPEARSRAVSAVRVAPAPDSFYRQEDPLTRMMSLPGLLALDCKARHPWGPLETLDPFTCNLTLTALSAGGETELAASLKGHSGECEIVTVTAEGRKPLPASVVEVLRAQEALLKTGAPLDDFVGRVSSAGLVAINALHFCGRSAQTHRVSQATEQSLSEGTAQPLQRALAQLFTPLPALSAPSSALSSGASSPTARTVRIDAGRVEELVRLAGEFAVVKNAIGHISKLAMAQAPAVAGLLKDRHASLEHLVNELQNSVLGMRLRPLSTVLQRFPRLVREIASDLDKAVQLTIEGDGAEADKAIVEMLFEPLLHLVRNAIDHGVEAPQRRAASGKPPTATLQIRAQRLGAQLLVEISDDGVGIDTGRVAAVAKARGLATEEQLHAMAEADVINLIFAPGFSTASQVTQLSGRGVGMDAVRKAVERVGGSVDISSRTGQGTTVKLLLPSSAIMARVMTVEAGGQMFGLPLDSIVETARVTRDSIAQVGSAQAIVLRNRTIPLLDLAAIVGSDSASANEADATVVVVAANGGWGGIRVDRVVERLDLILKPLDGLLTGTPGVAGTTLLGDGRVLLVLDVGAMLQ